MAGLMIDDFVLIEKRRKSDLHRSGVSQQPLQSSPQHASLQSSPCEEIIQEVRALYDKVGLPRHPDKAVSNAAQGTFWGMDFDGDARVLRPCLKRSVPVGFIILEMLKLGKTSVGLLEVLAGSLVSIFQCRRRFMSCLQFVYEEQRGRKRSDILTISSALETELLQCVALLPLACIDMRLRPSPLLIASDASPWATAAVSTHLSQASVEEFQKYGLQKGMWNRLLSPVGAYLREKGLLEAEEELPGKQSFDMHPLWDEIVETKVFSQFGKVSSRKGRQHINLGEVDAALDAEELQGREDPGSYYVHLQDSQVSLACLVKGRSSFAAINKKLRKSIPSHVANNNRAFYGYVRSKKNPADAPTRSRKVPSPTREPAPWLARAEEGFFEDMEVFLRQHGVDLFSLRELPMEEDLMAPCDVDVRTCMQRKRVRRQNKRKHSNRAGETSSYLHSSKESLAVPVPAPSPCTPPSQPSRCFSPGSSSPSFAIPLPEAHPRKGLPEELRNLLKQFDASQFVLSKEFSTLEEAFDAGPGILDLFAGSRGFQKLASDMLLLGL